MKSRGVVTLVFDDGYEKVYQTVVPLLRQYHWPAVFALPLDTDSIAATTGQIIRPWPEWLPIRRAGHEIAAHTVHHADLTALAARDIDAELREPREKLGATTLVYPGGASNPAVTEQARRYYTAARGLTRGFESLPPARPLNLKSYDFTRANFSVAKANLLVLWAWLTNSWLIETYHLIDDTEQTLTHTVKPDLLSRHLRFIAALPVAVRTIENVMRSYGP